MSNEPHASRTAYQQPDPTAADGTLNDTGAGMRGEVENTTADVPLKIAGAAPAERITVVPVPPLSETSLFETTEAAAQAAPRPLVMMIGSRGIPNVQGGVEKHIEMIGTELVQMGWDVDVIGRRHYLPSASQTMWNGIRIIPLWAPRKMVLEAIGNSVAAVFYAARQRPDILHIHAVGPALVAPLARLFGLKVIITHHGYDYERQKWGWFAKRMLKMGEAFGMYTSNGRIAISQEIVRAMRREYGVAVDFVPNGVSVQPRIASTDTLKTFGLTPRRYIVMMARLVPEKRQHDLIHAFAKANRPEKLVIVGGADHETEYSAHVKALAARTPLVVMTGFQTGAALAELYSNAALFVLPSSHEGMPIALLEALSYGLPVLASDIAANRELNLAPADYFAMGDVDALAAALGRKLSSPFDEDGKDGLTNQIQTDYSWKKIGERTAAVYRSVLPHAENRRSRWRGQPNFKISDGMIGAGAPATSSATPPMLRSNQEVLLGVSIIIKTLNEEKRIAATIESALAALPRGLGEVIIADSGSSDRTAAIASGYPVTVVQIAKPAQPSCGIGPQLGFQYSRFDHICLLDGDMILDPEFLPEALRFLADNPQVGGVTGHVEEMLTANLEYARRVQRKGPENRTGDIDRMNGGGLYRRSAIEKAGYLSDRNLHGHEEFDLGIRLRSAGWRLHRLDRRYVQHFGHTLNSYRLLVRRWKNRYLQGVGELLRASLGKPYFTQLLRELPELKLWSAVYAWWALSAALLLFLPDKGLALGLVLALLAGIIALMSWRKGGLAMGFYTVVTWFFHASALPLGFLRRRRPPAAPIESRILHKPARTAA
jgi:glycosyltransferase involved in cell wall biosynthesis